MTDKMRDFINEVDKLCFEHGYELWPCSGFDGLLIRVDSKYGTEEEHVLSFDGDGNGE